MNEYLAVVRSLKPVLKDGRSLDSSWDTTASPLAKQICYGVLRDFFRLDAIVGHLVRRPIPEKNIEVRILILAGLYSIDAIGRPAYASVNEVVETAATVDRPWAKGLINGVLRNYIRNRDSIAAKLSSVQARTNHPEWLAEAINGAWPDQTGRIFDANNEKAPMTLRVNTQKTTRQDYLSLLEGAGIAATPGDISPVAVYLHEPSATDVLPGFDDGLASVQDEASQLAAALLAPAVGEAILDACAAPGGKTCHLLETQPGMVLTALDIDRKRMNQVRQNLSRIGISCETVIADLAEWHTEVRFDRILLDAPCSATGIIRRHPDIKLLRRESDVAKLVSAQMRLLHAAWRLLKEGGTLVYSTCSILPAENEGVVRQFLVDEDDASSVPIEETWGISTGTGRQLLPKRGAHDGFYYARMVKRA